MFGRNYYLVLGEGGGQNNLFHAHEDDYYISSSVLSFGFGEEDYQGNEGPDRRSTLPNAPCTVTVRLDRTTIEEDLTYQLIPQTIDENVNANGPPPTATLRGANASSENAYVSTIYTMQLNQVLSGERQPGIHCLCLH